MSEFHVEVVKIGPVRKHPDADTLSITNIYGDSYGQGGYPVVFRTEEFMEGDRAVYVPVDCVVPDTEAWHFLAPQPRVKDGVVVDPGIPVGSVPDSYRRIKARRLRGIFSMGILAQAPRGVPVGTDVAEELGITRWEPKDPSDGRSDTRMPSGDSMAGPTGWVFPKYTDIEPLRKYWSILSPDEEVVCTEKVHGMNGRWCHDGERLWVGSHERVKRPGGDDAWNRIAERYRLGELLKALPMHVIYGEVYGRGSQNDMTYTQEDLTLAVFDIARLDPDGRGHTYLDYDTMVATAQRLGLPVVPVLYRGAWSSMPEGLQEGTTVLGGGAHVREGFVVRPVLERHHDRIGRVVLKMVGAGYHLRSAGAAEQAKRAAAKAERRAVRSAHTAV